MDYLTESFTPERLVPSKNLVLPLQLNAKNKQHQNWPTLLGGKLYTQETHKSITCWDERTLEILCRNDSESFVLGLFAVCRNSFLTGIEKNSSEVICRISTDDLAILEIIDKNVIASTKSIADDKYEILHCKIKENKDDARPPTSLTRIDRGAGDIIWSFHPKRVMVGHAMNSRIIVVHDVNEITALSIESGAIIWQHPVTDYDFPPKYQIQDSGVSIFNDIAIVAMKSHEYFGLDINTGELLWKTERGSGGSACINSEGWLYRIDHDLDDRSYCLWQVKCLTGIIEKKLKLNLEQFSDEAREAMGDSIYVDVTGTHFWAGTGKGLLFAVNLETGDIDWQRNLGGQFTNLMICNNRLYASTQDLSQLHENILKTEMFIFDGAGGYKPD